MANVIDIFNNKIDESKIVGDSKFFNKREELTEFNKLQQKYISNVDYSNPTNFARFGSAEEYYKNAINYINSEFPYDSCTTDKLKWVNSLNEFEYYIYNKEYPRSTGYVYLTDDKSIGIYSPFTSNQKSAKETYYNNSNLSATGSLDFDNSITFESWVKFDDTTYYTQAQIFSISAISGSGNNFTQTSVFGIIRNNDGTLTLDGANQQFTTILEANKWYHLSIVVNTNYSLLYLNGQLKEKVEFSAPLAASFHKYSFSELGLFYDSDDTVNCEKSTVFALGGGNPISFDDTRLWNGLRSTEDIGRYWFTNIDGNDFTDIFNSNLLFYYKFNEGWDQQYGFLCLDYSGHQNDAEIFNYIASCRLSESAFDLSGIVQDKEFGEIIFKGLSYSTSVQEFYNEKLLLAKDHDEQNIHLLYNKFPGWILEQEESLKTKHLKQIIQIVSSYFDDLYNKIGELTEYKKIKYESDNEKIYPFYDKILTSMGFDITDLFSNLDSVEKISSRNDITLFDDDIQKTKNKIFQNIYNNLSYILKSKGTGKSIKSLLKSYGLTEELVRINLYADGAEYSGVDRTRQAVVRKKALNLVGNSFVSTEQTSDINENVIGYDKINYYTLETAVSFDSSLTASQPLTSSIFGIKSILGSELTSDINDVRYFFTVTLENDKNLGSRFVLTDISSSLTSSSPYYKNLYDNNVWNLALRKKPTVDTLFGQTGSLSYVLDLYGINKNSHFEQEFSCSLPILLEPYILNYYIGSNQALETTSTPGYMTILPANSKFYYCNFWTDYLTNETLQAHNRELLSYGVNE